MTLHEEIAVTASVIRCTFEELKRKNQTYMESPTELVVRSSVCRGMITAGDWDGLRREMHRRREAAITKRVLREGMYE